MKNFWIKKKESSENLIVENQRLYNKLCLERQPHNWEDVSIKTAKALRDCVGLQLVTCQPMEAPASLIRHKDENEDTVETPILAKTKQIKSTCYRDLPNDLAAEVSREIITDLRNNVGFIHEISAKEHDTLKEFFNYVGVSIHCAFAKIAENTSHQGRKWIVTSPEIAAALEAVSSFKRKDRPGIGPYHAGETGTFDVYIDPLYPMNDILVGQVTEGACYSYNPYIPVACYPQNVDPILYQFCTRYSKRLPEGANKNYAKLIIKDFM